MQRIIIENCERGSLIRLSKPPLAPKTLQMNSLLKHESPSYVLLLSVKKRTRHRIRWGTWLLNNMFFVCFHVKSSASNEDNRIWLLTNESKQLWLCMIVFAPQFGQVNLGIWLMEFHSSLIYYYSILRLLLCWIYRAMLLLLSWGLIYSLNSYIMYMGLIQIRTKQMSWFSIKYLSIHE